MKKINFTKWQSVSPSLVFGEGAGCLNITWPDYQGKNEYIDPLTEVPNRRAFDETTEMAVEYSNRQGAGFGLIIFDIDHFKKINDTHGHQAGDKALQTFSSLIKTNLRANDFFSRFGGEEFCVITPVWQKVFDIGERIRKDVESEPFNIGDAQIKVTCSFGCATYPSDGINFEKVFKCADKALYQAKNDVRNRGCQHKNST